MAAASEIPGDAVFLPIAIANRLRAFAPADFLNLFGFCRLAFRSLASGLSLGQCALGGGGQFASGRVRLRWLVRRNLLRFFRRTARTHVLGMRHANNRVFFRHRNGRLPVSYGVQARTVANALAQSPVRCPSSDYMLRRNVITRPIGSARQLRRQPGCYSSGNDLAFGDDLAMSTLKTGFFLAVLTALFVGVGAVIGGQTGMVIAFAIAVAMNVFTYWNSDKMVLRMHNAIEVDERSAPELYDIVRQLVANADMPMPRVYIMKNPQPNAFATGRNPENAAVAATTGLLDMLTKEEVAGVMAHELAHVQNRDTLIMTVTASIAGAISMLANFAFFFGGARGGGERPNFIVVLLICLLAPFAAGLVQMAISRTREYEADKLGAWICQRPLWLASALEKISGNAARIRNASAEDNPASAHMFIINPLHGESFDSWFSTHPNTQNRIDALVGMEEARRADGGYLEAQPLKGDYYSQDSGSVDGPGRGGGLYGGGGSVPNTGRRPKRGDPRGPWG